MQHVLVIEDEPHVRKLLQVNLEREGLTVVACDDGETALQLFEQNQFQLVILDWMIKGPMNGLDVCKKLAGRVPILMVTARSTLTDIVLGLEMGADDYLTKPFEIPIFLARVRALLRRSVLPKTGVQPESFAAGDLKLNVSRFEVFCQDTEIKLTPSEFKILVLLIKRPGSVLSRTQLLQEIQESGIAVTDRTIDTHIYSLRSKLGACANTIETIRGIGYRIKS